MGGKSPSPRRVRVRLHKAVRDEREYEPLGKDGLRQLIELLRTYPDVGIPLFSPLGARIRVHQFRGFEIVTQRVSTDELQIISIR